MTRTHQKHSRIYVNGVDFSGYSRSIGALNWSFDAEPDSALTDEVKNILLGKGNITASDVNAFLDNDTAGVFANLTRATRNVMIPIGANAAPAAGSPVFAWTFEDIGYKAEQGSGFVAAMLPLSEPSYASTLAYKKPWGWMLHAKAAETDVNAATGIDDNGASSALGGIFVYQLFSSDGTVTLKAQDAATNSDISFADITSATSGSITAEVTPQSGMIPIGTTATVRRYLRWQLELGTATTATFACAFIRNSIA